MRYEYQPQNVCAQQISFDLEGNVVRNIEFYRRPTSCADQLAIAVRKAYNEQ